MKIPFFTCILLLTLFTYTLQYNPQTAYEMLKTASASYCNPTQLKNMGCGEVCNKLKGYTFLKQYSKNVSSTDTVSYSMFVNPSQKKFVVSFRGSRGVSQIVDQVLHSQAITYDLCPVKNAVAGKYFYTNYKDNIRADFLANIKTMAQKYKDYQFYITGHSLGGALANLAALDISCNNIIPKARVHMYTYGAPRVGDYNLAKAIVNSVGEHYRVTHGKDIVPHVPLCIVNVLTGGCAAWENHPNQNGMPVFNAWHTWPEVHYETDDLKKYKICSEGEDKTCADQYKLAQTSIADHIVYLGDSTRCLGNGVSADAK